MKTLLLSFALFASLTSTHAKSEIIKSCDASFEFDGNSARMFFEVKKNANNNLSGTVDSMGFVSEYEKVEASTHSVREGLAGELIDLEGPEDLNFGEQIVVHAMAVEELEMSSGIDLKKVRSITVYHFVEEGVNIGMLAIAEARDQDGKVMGSFMGGFLVAPCK